MHPFPPAFPNPLPEEVRRDVEVLLKDDGIARRREDVEGGGEGGLVVLGDAGVPYLGGGGGGH